MSILFHRTQSAPHIHKLKDDMIGDEKNKGSLINLEGTFHSVII